MKLVLMSPAMNLGWVMMSLNTWKLWLTPVGRGRREEGGERRKEEGGGREKGGGRREEGEERREEGRENGGT